MSCLLIWGDGRGGSRGRAGGLLRWFAHPISDTVCRVHVQYPAFAPGSSEVVVEFLIFLYLVVHNLPQLGMHTVIFNPL